MHNATENYIVILLLKHLKSKVDSIQKLDS